jgi:hypothetical protein
MRDGPELVDILALGLPELDLKSGILRRVFCLELARRPPARQCIVTSSNMDPRGVDMPSNARLFRDMGLRLRPQVEEAIKTCRRTTIQMQAEAMMHGRRASNTRKEPSGVHDDLHPGPFNNERHFTLTFPLLQLVWHPYLVLSPSLEALSPASEYLPPSQGRMLFLHVKALIAPQSCIEFDQEANPNPAAVSPAATRYISG